MASPPPNAKVLVTDGPYLETKEHIGVFWVLEAANLDDALAWGRKAAVACRAPVEVRPILLTEDPTEATARQRLLSSATATPLTERMRRKLNKIR